MYIDTIQRMCMYGNFLPSVGVLPRFQPSGRFRTVRYVMSASTEWRADQAQSLDTLDI